MVAAFAGDGTVTNDVFAQCREAVTARAAAERYGIEVRHSGMACCPFHQDRTPSMKLDRRFHCFGCQADGDAIDFTARLFSLTPLEAVKRLNEDFGLGLDIGGPMTAESRQKAAESRQKRQRLQDTWSRFEAWRTDMERQLNRCICVANCALKQLETPADLDGLTPGQCEAVRLREVLTAWADALHGDMAEQMEIFRLRGEVAKVCSRVLKTLTRRSSVA